MSVPKATLSRSFANFLCFLYPSALHCNSHLENARQLAGSYYDALSEGMCSMKSLLGSSMVASFAFTAFRTSSPYKSIADIFCQNV